MSKKNQNNIYQPYQSGRIRLAAKMHLPRPIIRIPQGRMSHAIVALMILQCASARPGYYQTADGQWRPDIAQCARYEFPPRARKHVDAALIVADVSVDAKGMVTAVQPKTLQFEKNVPREIQEMLTPDFEQAIVAALLYEKCPVHIVNGKAVPYKVTGSFFYEVKDDRGIRYQPSWADEKAKELWQRRELEK